MHTELSLREIKKEWHGTLRAYIIGFILSFLLTCASFFLVITKTVTGNVLLFSLAGLALAQAVVQLRFLLHLGQEAKPRWETFVFYLMLFFLLVIVVGSLWIMYDLNHRVMSHD